MRRDPYLTAIIDHVERSGEPVDVYLVLHSGAVVTGFVRPSHRFADLTARGTDALRQKLSRPKDDYQRGLLARLEQKQAIVESVRGDDTRGANAEHITLSDVKMIWSGGDGMQVPTVRLSLDAVAGWWLAPGQAITGNKDKGGGFLAVGVEL
jgi:hypothetical protein